MVKGTPYFVDIVVPRAALLDDKVQQDIAQSPLEHNVVWYRNKYGPSTSQDWPPENDVGVVAYPVEPNMVGIELHPNGGVAFTAEKNSGLVAQGALSTSNCFTCAVRFISPKGEARTLVTINAHDAENYLYLNEKNGTLSWSDQSGSAEVSLNTPATPSWVVVGMDHGRISITTAPEGNRLAPPVASEVRNPQLIDDFSGSSDLFIGCRSHRKGILKTLGTSQIMDVMLFANTFALTQDFSAQLNAMCRYVEIEGQPL